MQKAIHCVIIYNSRGLDTIQMPIHTGLRNYDMFP